MAKRKHKNLGRAVDDLIDKIIVGALSGKNRSELARMYAEQASEIIRIRTRNGLGVAKDGGVMKPLKKLTGKYVAYRRRNSRKLHPDTSPGKSNLTFTGRLLDSLTAQKRAGGRYVLVFKGIRKRGLTNAQLAKYVAERGRPFMYLSAIEQITLAKSYRRNFKNLVGKEVK